MQMDWGTKRTFLLSLSFSLVPFVLSLPTPSHLFLYSSDRALFLPSSDSSIRKQHRHQQKTHTSTPQRSQEESSPVPPYQRQNYQTYSTAT
ncbi:MAG: hypothetical protein J3R72DRAFT_54889 [Linnemannia gamsii]|nr:MAG: hypothetical protein J3R72DRAFT_54889 [Linnemannia gamsii]